MNYELEFFLTLVTAIIVIIGAILNLRKYFRRKIQDKEYNDFLKNPFKSINFLVPKESEIKLSYCKQEKNKHFTFKELEFPKNHKDLIFIMTSPEENFEIGGMYYGFEGEKGKKPKIISCKSPFVQKSNLNDVQWYQDWHEDFHLVKEKKYFKYEYYVTTFEIQSYEEGVYNLYIKFPIISNRFKGIMERRQEKVIIKELKLIVK